MEHLGMFSEIENKKKVSILSTYIQYHTGGLASAVRKGSNI
jgi:hypothetical protein